MVVYSVNPADLFRIYIVQDIPHPTLIIPGIGSGHNNT